MRIDFWSWRQIVESIFPNFHIHVSDQFSLTYSHKIFIFNPFVFAGSCRKSGWPISLEVSSTLRSASQVDVGLIHRASECPMLLCHGVLLFLPGQKSTPSLSLMDIVSKSFLNLFMRVMIDSGAQSIFFFLVFYSPFLWSNADLGLIFFHLFFANYNLDFPKWT